MAYNQKRSIIQGTQVHRDAEASVAKMRTYAEAKQADANLGKYISERKKHKKGSDAYNVIQNKINKAYGVGKRHETTAGKVGKTTGKQLKALAKRVISKKRERDAKGIESSKSKLSLAGGIAGTMMAGPIGGVLGAKYGKQIMSKGKEKFSSFMDKYKSKSKKNTLTPRGIDKPPVYNPDFKGKKLGDKASDAAFYGWAGGASAKYANKKLGKTKPVKALKTTTKKVATKAGLKTGLKVTGKLASRAVPVLGQAMLAWDIGKAAYYGFKGGSIKAGLKGLAKDYGINWSDARVKENITRTGASESGIPIYTFNYKDSNKLWSGTMAQDLLNLGRKDAVKMMDNGYYGVDYNKIDVDMVSKN